METTATVNQLERALNHVNTKFNGNIRFKRGPEGKSQNRRSFTLTVKHSRLPGGRIGHTGRRVSAACWHVHGEFFEYLFNDGITLIKAGSKVMKGHADNWQDWNIGSIYQPMYYSGACDCDR